MSNFGDVLIKISHVKSPIESVAYDNNNDLLIVGQAATDADTATLSVIDVNSGKVNDIIEKSENSNNSIWKLLIDRTGNFYIYLKQVYNGDNRYIIVIYDIKTKDKKTILDVNNDDKYLGFYITPDNKLAIGYENIIELWDIENKILMEKKILNEKYNINDDHCFMTMTFTADNRFAAIGGIIEEKILVYDLHKNLIVDSISINFSFPRNLLYTANNNFLAIADFWQKGFYVWDFSNKAFYKDDTYNDEFELITCCAISNEFLILGMKTSVVKILDFTKGKTLFRDKIHSGRITNVLVSHDGRRLISAGEDGQIIIRHIG